jgi:putative ABC transport system ATP-binding protein
MKIRTEELTKIYGKLDAEVNALDNVNLEINQGEFITITGASGSGKTTLLNMLGGLDTPTSGKVFYDDEDIYGLTDDKLSEIRLKKIGFVFQFFNLLPELTAKENIMLPLLIDKKKLNNDFFTKITDTLGVTDRLTHLPSELSGGQQQRVAIARALINNPDVILCDEPTGNLDAKASADVIELLKLTHEEFGKTVIIVTHDKKLAEKAERTIVIADGKVVEPE